MLKVFDCVVGVMEQHYGDGEVLFDVLLKQNTVQCYPLPESAKIVATLNEKAAAMSFADDLVANLIDGGHDAARGGNYVAHVD